MKTSDTKQTCRHARRTSLARALCALLLLALTPAASFAMSRVYAGHYASGSALFTYDHSHLWRGHYASGSAIATWDSRDDVPDGVIAFLATQLLD